MNIELTEDRRETVDIVEFVLDAAARYAQPIAERLLSIGDCSHEEAVPMNPNTLGGNVTRSRLDDSHLLRRRQHRPHVDPVIDAVHAEKRERVVVVGLDDGLDLRVKPLRRARLSPPVKPPRHAGLDPRVKRPRHACPFSSWPESRESLLAECRPRRGGSLTRKTPRRRPFRA